MFDDPCRRSALEEELFSRPEFGTFLQASVLPPFAVEIQIIHVCLVNFLFSFILPYIAHQNMPESFDTWKYNLLFIQHQNLCCSSYDDHFFYYLYITYIKLRCLYSSSTHNEIQKSSKTGIQKKLQKTLIINKVWENGEGEWQCTMGRKIIFRIGSSHLSKIPLIIA